MTAEETPEDKSIEVLSKAFEKAINDFSPFFDLMGDERKKMHKLISKENINRGKILNYHLILENLIERVLSASIPDYNPEKLRLSFFNKAQLLPTTNKFYRLFLDGVMTVNRIRNKYAHNLEFEISESDISDIRPFVEKARRISLKEEILTPIEIVEEFVTIVCTILIFYTPELMAISLKLKEEYPGIFYLFENVEKECNTLKDLVDRYPED